MSEVVLLLELGLALALAKVFGEVFERFGQPAVIGEILVGVILGKELLGPMLGVDVSGEIFAAFATVGIMLLLFLSGLEVEFKRLKETGKLATFVAFGGVLLPFIGGYAVGIYEFHDPTIAMLLGAVLTATSVGVTARILVESKVLDTKAGSTILGAAVIDDLLGIMAIVIVSSIAVTGTVSLDSVGILGVKMLAFFLITLVLGLKVIGRVTDIFEKMNIEKAFIALCLSMGFLFGVLAESVQIAAITGAFIAGLIIGETPYRRRAADEIKTLGYGFFIPLFFVSVGTWINFAAFNESLELMILLLFVAVFGKLLGCGLPARLSGCGMKEAAIIGVGMIPRLEMGLVVAAIGVSVGMAGDPSGSLAKEVLSLAVVISIVTGILPLFFLRPLLKGYGKE